VNSEERMKDASSITIYAIRTHFQAIAEYLMILHNYFH